MLESATRRLLLAAVLFVTTLAGQASAQGFISPYIGSTFSKPPLDACTAASGCEDGKRTIGVGLGTLGRIFGAEFDIGYTKAFFGETGDTASSGLMTIMGNVMVAPKIGPVQPYVLGGIGVLRLHVDSVTSTFTDNDESKLAWDVGGGVILFFGGHIGVRGDIRHFRALQDVELLAVTIQGTDLRFNRASAAVVLKF
jgi:opacity protein-like surface antigen